MNALFSTVFNNCISSTRLIISKCLTFLFVAPKHKKLSKPSAGQNLAFLTRYSLATKMDLLQESKTMLNPSHPNRNICI